VKHNLPGAAGNLVKESPFMKLKCSGPSSQKLIIELYLKSKEFVSAFLKRILILFPISHLTNSVALVLEQTIPTERPPLVGEVSANFCGIEGCRMVSAADPLQP
jgi:hypothetical protein